MLQVHWGTCTENRCCNWDTGLCHHHKWQEKGISHGMGLCELLLTNCIPLSPALSCTWTITYADDYVQLASHFVQEADLFTVHLKVLSHHHAVNRLLLLSLFADRAKASCNQVGLHTELDIPQEIFCPDPHLQKISAPREGSTLLSFLPDLQSTFSRT